MSPWACFLLSGSSSYFIKAGFYSKMRQQIWYFHPKQQRIGEWQRVGEMSDSWIRSLNSQRRMTLAFISEDVGNNQQRCALMALLQTMSLTLWRVSIKASVALFLLLSFSVAFQSMQSFTQWTLQSLKMATFSPHWGWWCNSCLHF